MGPRCALRYTSYNVQRSPRNPQSAGPLLRTLKENLRYEKRSRCTIRRKQLFPPRSLVNRKASNATPNESSKRDDATTVTRFRPRALLLLCAYTRISSKRNTGSRAFNRLAYVAMRYVMNTHGVHVTLQKERHMKSLKTNAIFEIF